GTSVAFDLIGVVREEPIWWAIAHWNIALGLAAAIVAAVTGLSDALAIQGDPPATRKAIRHLVVVVSAVACYGAALAVRRGPHPPEGTQLTGVLVLEVLGLGLLLLGGWLGAELVYGEAEAGAAEAATPSAAPADHRPPGR
ncbi:MAG TPA: DUF2231 domain-containing protein, partial [Vulgatibacter sp.]